MCAGSDQLKPNQVLFCQIKVYAYGKSRPRILPLELSMRLELCCPCCNLVLVCPSMMAAGPTADKARWTFAAKVWSLQRGGSRTTAQTENLMWKHTGLLHLSSDWHRWDLAHPSSLPLPSTASLEAMVCSQEVGQQKPHMSMSRKNACLLRGREEEQEQRKAGDVLGQGLVWAAAEGWEDDRPCCQSSRGLVPTTAASYNNFLFSEKSGWAAAETASCVFCFSVCLFNTLHFLVTKHIFKPKC